MTAPRIERRSHGFCPGPAHLNVTTEAGVAWVRPPGQDDTVVEEPGHPVDVCLGVVLLVVLVVIATRAHIVGVELRLPGLRDPSEPFLDLGLGQDGLTVGGLGRGDQQPRPPRILALELAGAQSAAAEFVVEQEGQAVGVSLLSEYGEVMAVLKCARSSAVACSTGPSSVTSETPSCRTLKVSVIR